MPEELLPPPPKKSQALPVDAGELLPPPPKKKISSTTGIPSVTGSVPPKINFNQLVKNLEKLNRGRTDIKDYVDPRLNKIYRDVKAKPQEKDFVTKAISATFDMAGDLIPDRVKNAWERGKLQGENASLLPIFSRPDANTEELAAKIAANERLSQQIPQTPEAKKLDEKGVIWALKNPVEGAKAIGETIISSLASQLKASERTSLQSTAIGAGMGSVIPGIGTAVGAATGLTAGQILAGMNVENSSTFLQTLKDAGFPTDDEVKLAEAFKDKKLIDKARSLGIKRGVPIAIFDMLAAGVGGRLATSTLNKVAKPLAVAGVEALGGSTGELAAQISAGQQIDPNAIALEGIAELGAGAPALVSETAGATIERKKTSSSNENIIKQIARDKETGVKEAKENLDRHLEDGLITPEDHAEGTAVVEKIAAVNEKIPESVEGEGREKVIELVSKKEDTLAEIEALNEEKKKTEETFHEPIDGKIARREAKIEELNKEIKSVVSTQSVLTKAETDLEALKQVTDKVKKYEGSMKRLVAAKDAKQITTGEFNEMKKRFDDVMKGSDLTIRAETPVAISENESPASPEQVATAQGRPIDFNANLYAKKMGEWNRAANEAWFQHIDDQLLSGERLSDAQVKDIANSYNNSGRLEDAEKLLTDYGYTKNNKGFWAKKEGEKSEVANKPATGAYEGDTDFEIRNPQQLNIDDVLERENPIKLYPEQIVPIEATYSKKSSYWVAPKKITIREGYGSIEIDKGDKIYISVDSPANGDASSPTSYKVHVKNRSYPLSHFIPETAEGGSLNDAGHWDIMQQMRNFDKVLKGELETPHQAEERRIKIAEELIPEGDFYTAKPYNSHAGFETPQKVIFKDGKWLRLRGEEWDDSKDYAYNVWDEYDTKNALAWDIVKNARVVLKDKTEDPGKVWDEQYNFKTSENKKRYLKSKGENTDAVQIESASRVLQHPQEGVGETGSGRERVEPVVEGDEVAETRTSETVQEGEKSFKVGDKVKFIDHLGEPETGKVLEIRPDGNLSVLKSNGVKNNLDPKKLSHATAQDRRNAKAAERIQVQRKTPEKSEKKLHTIIKDLTTALKAPLIYAKSARRNALGTYHPQNALINLRNAGDLDTAAHEIGHLIDDRHDLLAKTTPAMRDHLKWFSDRGGSNPPKGADKAAYLGREGLAEFIRAYIANPAEAKAVAPELYELFEDTVNADTLKAIKTFSDDYIRFANAPAGDQILSNILETPDLKEKQSTVDWLLGRSNSTSGFELSWVDDLKAQVTNSLHVAQKAFDYAKNLKGVGTLLPEKNFETMARVFGGENGKLDRIFKSGLVDTKNKYIKDNGKNMSTKWLFEPLDATSEKTLKQESVETIQYLIAQRTLEYAKKFGRQNKLSGIGGGIRSDVSVATEYLEDFNKLDEAKKARIEEAARRYREYADQGLQYAVDKGRISQEQYDAIKEGNQYYVSLARAGEISPTEESLAFVNKSAKGGLTSVKQVLHKAKGGTGLIQNPYVSLLKNTADLITDSDRNAVLQNFVDVLQENRNMGEGEVKALAAIGRPVQRGEKNTKTIYIDGKPQPWQFNEDVYKSLTALESGASGGLGEKIATALPKMLRWSVTHFPAFAAKNLIRDTQQRLIQSRSGGSLKDLVHTMGDRELFDLYGGSQAGFHLASKEAYYDRMNGAIKELTDKGGVVLDPRRMGELGKSYVKFLEKSENVNRIAEFKSAFRKAKSEGLDDYNAGLYAAYQGRDLLDFAVAGHFIRTLNRYIPFTNAAVQGLRRTINGVKENPKGFAIKMALYSLVPQIATRIINTTNGDDEEYEQLPFYQRDLFYNFKTPLTGDKWISIPKPFDLGLVSSGIDRLMSLGKGEENAFDNYPRSLYSVLSPFDESTLLPVAKPLIEIIANKDFYRDEPIVPHWEENLMLNKRTGTKYASNLGKMLAEPFGFDPRNVDHALRGFTSYYGDAAMRLSNIGHKEGKQFGIEQSGLVRERPASNSRDVMETYDLAEELGVEKRKDVQRLKDMVRGFYEARNEKERNVASTKIFQKAKELREKLEKAKIKELNK